MQVVPIKGFPHDRRGQLIAGRAYEFDDAEAHRLIAMRLVRPASPDECAEKVMANKPASGPIPSQAAGEAQPSSASQAAQASPQTTAKRSGAGARKKAKRKRGA